MKNLFKTGLLAVTALIATSCGVSPDSGGGGGNKTFIMESEYVDFTGIVGGGNSTEKRECGMIYGDGTDADKAKGWSNGYFVAYTHKAGVIFDYVFNSDKAVENATLVIRMASEMGAVTFGPDEFKITINNVEVDYEGQYLENYPTLEEMRFKDKTITPRLNIQQGRNVLTLEIMENNLTGAGTIGPILDCVKITSNANLTWNPLTDNPDHRGDI